MLGLAQVLGGAPICCILWFLFGFSVVFGDSIGGVIGNPGQYAGFGDLFTDCYQDTRIPTSSYAMFQMMFASIAPLLITGAYAGRLSVAASLWFTALWEVLPKARAAVTVTMRVARQPGVRYRHDLNLATLAHSTRRSGRAT